MAPIVVTRNINAPIPKVFATVADIRQFAEAVPHVVNYEFLTDSQLGVGTRFRETRRMQGKETTTELEVTDYAQDDRVRLVAVDPMGTTWDTLFTVSPAPGGTLLTMTMEATPKKWFARIFVFLIRGMIRRAVERDLDLVKAFCEQR